MTSTNLTQTEKNGHYTHVNGINMYYEVHGTGKPLVLIHGGGSSINVTFGRILPMLAKSHQIIAVELQAHGHTSDRDAPETFEQDADDVAELLKQLNIPQADILGFSNGGNTALRLATRHPHLVRKLVAASVFYKRSGMYDWFWGFMKQASLEQMPQQLKDEYLRINPNNHVGLQAMHDHDARRMQTFVDWKNEDISSITAPTLIVVGDQDVMRTEHAVEMYRLLPHGRLAVYPSNHGGYIGEIMSIDSGSKLPEAFAAMITEFLSEPLP